MWVGVSHSGAPHSWGVPHKIRVPVHSKSMGRTEGANILTPHQDENSYLSSAVVYNSYGPPLMQGPPQKPEKRLCMIIQNVLS